MFVRSTSRHRQLQCHHAARAVWSLILQLKLLHARSSTTFARGTARDRSRKPSHGVQRILQGPDTRMGLLLVPACLCEILAETLHPNDPECFSCAHPPVSMKMVCLVGLVSDRGYLVHHEQVREPVALLSSFCLNAPSWCGLL